MSRHLPKIEFNELRELVVEAWLLSAPRSLTDQHEQRLVGGLDSPAHAAAPTLAADAPDLQ